MSVICCALLFAVCCVLLYLYAWGKYIKGFPKTLWYLSLDPCDSNFMKMICMSWLGCNSHPNYVCCLNFCSMDSNINLSGESLLVVRTHIIDFLLVHLSCFFITCSYIYKDLLFGLLENKSIIWSNLCSSRRLYSCSKWLEIQFCRTRFG